MIQGTLYEKLKALFDRDIRYAKWGGDVELVEHSFTGEKGDCVRIRLYTETNCYAIVAKDRGDSSGELKNTYLGCIASTRKPRAGEDWTRGNDLPDGPVNEETWRKILGAIVGYELVKVHTNPEIQGEIPELPVSTVESEPPTVIR